MLPSLCTSIVPLFVTWALLPTYQAPFDTMLTMPALESGRPSSTMVVRVMVVPFGIEIRPLPESVPLLQVIDEPVRLIGAVPVSVPKPMVSVGMEMAEALLRVSVPLVIVTEPTLVMELMVAVPPLQFVAPVML